jgi:hypothetical protein
MKKNVLKTGIAALLLLLFSPGVMAKVDNANVITQTRDVAIFDGIKVSGVFNVFFTQGEPQSVKIETDENIMDKISTKVNNGILELGTRGNLNNPGRLNVYIFAKDLKSLNLGGASKFSTTDKITTSQLTIELSGIATAALTTDAATVKCNLSGVCKLDLNGTGDQLTADISGTSKLSASKFEVNDAKIKASGVSSAIVNALKTVDLDASGLSHLTYIPHETLVVASKKVTSYSYKNNKGENVTGESKVEENSDALAEVTTNGDSTKVSVGKLDLEVIDGPQTEVRLGKNKLTVNNNGKVQFYKPKRFNSFHSHWTGLYIGVSGYLTPSGRIDPAVHDNFMSLNMLKSTNIQLNFFEQNLRISPNAGFVTGLGIDYRNYRFDHSNVVLQSSAGYFDGILDPTNNYKKSKLLVTYLTVPLLFELQTNRFTNHHSFHIAGGISSGLRIGSHSKVKFDKVDGGTQKSKDRNDFNLNPFKADATVLIGWGSINLYGNYALINMFKMDKGPELRPFSVGFRIVFD